MKIDTVHVDQEVMEMQIKFQRMKNSRDKRISELTRELFEGMRKMEKILLELEEAVNYRVDFEICRALYLRGFKHGKSCR